MKKIKTTRERISGGKPVIALLGNELSFDIPINIFRAIKKISQQHNYKLLYFVGEAFKSPFDFHIQSNILYDMISPQIADGLIVISNLLCSFVAPQEFCERCLQFHPLPVISLGIALEGIPSVVPDNKAGMYEAVSHLIEAHHLSRIAFLSGSRTHPDVIERFAAFTRAMELHDLPVEKELLLQGNYMQESGIAAVKELLDNRRKIPGRDVQAIVCCNDYMASGVMLELTMRGIRIPEDISLVGFDDISFTECMSPSLSTVRQDFDNMAARATELLIELIKGGSVPDIVRVDANFIPRRSCGCPDAANNDDNPLLPVELEIMLDTDPDKFLKHLNQRIAVADIPTLTVWRKALSYLGNKDKRVSLPEAADLTGKIGQTAYALLGETAYNAFFNMSCQNTINEIGNALTSTMELSELQNILTTMLPKAGIDRCYICLYENPQNSPEPLPPRSRLILAFGPSGSYELPPGGLPFATEQLLPGKVISEPGLSSLVVIAFYFHDERLGYALMDSNALHENIYLSLRKQISDALNSARLMDKSRKAYSLLMEANEQKTQFFINVAHETKTPLTLIKNYMELYLEQHSPDEHLSVVKQNIDMLLDNMLNFLDVEKLEKGETIYQHNTLVDLALSADKKCALFRGIAEKKNIRIIVKTEGSVLIRIDPWALDRIFNNLIDNAIKYIQPGGRITVSVRRNRGQAILCISDNGPGLPAEACEHIFEPYYLLSNKKTSKHGIGVGLSIVKRIVDGMGASITMEKGRGGGAGFTIVFAAGTAAKAGAVLHEIPDITPAFLTSASIKERNISTEKNSLLIVDDNIQLLKFMQSFLENSYNVFIARDVPETLFKLKTMPRPDLIIADILLDGDDGFTLLSEISKTDGYNNIPFIFLTAMGGEEAKTKGLGLGAIDYIEKPFSIAQMLAKINSIIALRRRQERQDIVRIRNRIVGLFSGLEQNIKGPVKEDFDSLCRKFGINVRESEIIRLLMSGLLLKEIAARQNISKRAVAYHIAKIYKKCGVSSKYELFNKFTS